MPQAAGLVPIVEPELLIEGTHSAAEFAACTEVILGEVYGALAKANVHLEVSAWRFARTVQQHCRTMYFIIVRPGS